jgi:hypothetical protein
VLFEVVRFALEIAKGRFGQDNTTPRSAGTIVTSAKVSFHLEKSRLEAKFADAFSYPTAIPYRIA